MFIKNSKKLKTNSYEEEILALMKKHNLDCYLTFTSDCHLNEYIAPEDQRVLKLTEFSGSNGIAITCDEPVLVTDSRYFIQAAKQSRYPLYKGKPSEYIKIKGYKRVSFDTRMVSSESFSRSKEIFDANYIEFIPTDLCESLKRENKPIINLENIFLKDFLKFTPKYKNQENSSVNEIESYLQSLGFNDFNQNVTGSFYKDKIEKIRSIIQDSKLIICELDTIAWILNLRGSDIDYNPVFYSYLIIDKSSVLIFTDHEIELEGVKVLKYSEFENYLENFENENILISGDCNQFIFSKLKNAERTQKIREMQANKNQVELAGMALAYFYDGIALTNLFGFISKNESLTEASIADKLNEIKKEFKAYVGPSFDTISSTGPNSAIVHHSSTDTPVNKSEVFLLDSGSHYYFGTTDTTRTLCFGTDINKDLIHDYTLVLKGQILGMMEKYKEGSTYSQVDFNSRKYLKAESKDFGHATGHGVGHYLCVHEAPPTIYGNSPTLITENQVFSIEPGFYKENEYGIRIENLVFSKKVSEGYEFVNITMVPYQTRMADLEMLSDEEKRFLNNFNKQCYSLLKDFVDEDGLGFLEENTKDIE